MNQGRKLRYFYDTEFIEDGHTIDLISIGIVCEDGREFYAETDEYDADKASPWVIEHVLPYLTASFVSSRQAIKESILRYMNVERYGEPELWGYYSAYDHVAFCQLFGTMADLPDGFPMYTRDLKQWCDQLGDPLLPRQGKSQHHALADAKWNRLAWLFLHSHAGSHHAAQGGS